MERLKLSIGILVFVVKTPVFSTFSSKDRASNFGEECPLAIGYCLDQHRPILQAKSIQKAVNLHDNGYDIRRVFRDILPVVGLAEEEQR